MKPRPLLEVVVYHADPKELWAQKVTKVAVIYRVVTRWRWLARALARGNRGNTGNCCWLIRDATTGALLEEETAPTPYVEVLR